MKNLYCDVVIAGCGVAGLFTALHLPEDKKIVMLSKGDFESCDSMLAQGGICMLRNETDYESFYEDTMKAGHYENRAESVDLMIRNSQSVIKQLVSYGVEFNRNVDGSLAFTREGAHSAPRIDLLSPGRYRQRNHYQAPCSGPEAFKCHLNGIHHYDRYSDQPANLHRHDC